MTILGVDSSAVSAGCAVLRDGRVISEGYVNVGLTHSQTLLPLIDRTIKNALIKLSDIDRIAVTCGPGSFTGVRIGIATVKGLAFADSIPCVAVSTLEAIAMGATGLSGVICAVMDARREQVYNALFRCRDGRLERLCEDRAVTIAQLGGELSALGEKAWLCGDGAGVCAAKLCGENANLFVAPETVRWQNGIGTALAAEGKPACEPAALLPTYLRLPQAERELRARQKPEQPDI